MTDTTTVEKKTPAEIIELQRRVEIARLREPLESDPALYNGLNWIEKFQEGRTARRLRAAKRRERMNAAMAELRAESHNRRARVRAARTEQELAAVASIEERRLRTFQRAMWTSRVLVGLIVGAIAWSAVTVQRNLSGGLTPHDPQWWLGFFIEATLSGFVVAIMVLSTTAATWGVKIDRRQVIGFEVALVTAAVALNAGPHIADHDWGKAGQFSVAPIMVGAGMWLHGWISARYADLLDHAEDMVANAQHLASDFPPHGTEVALDSAEHIDGDEYIEVRALAVMIVEDVVARQSPIWQQPDRIERITTTIEQILDANDSGMPVAEIARTIGINPSDIEQVLGRAAAILNDELIAA
ncbi:hypothetical protein ACWF9G_23000 [Nocardia sp. NPDC055029]